MAAKKQTITRLTLACAVACLLTIIPQPALSQDVDQLYQQGNAAQDRGDFSEAENIFRQVTQIDPNDSGAYNNLGNAQYYQGKLEAAIASYKKAIDLDSNDPDIYNNLGNAQYYQEKLEAAIASYEKAIDLDPNNSGAFINLGSAQYYQGKFKAAIASYKEAIDLDSNDPDTYIGLGNALDAQGNLEKAITSYEKAIDLDPNNSGAYNNLGYALERQDKLEAAIKKYQRSLEIDPDLVAAKNNLREAERLLAIQLKPPLPDIDDTKFLPSVEDEPLVNILRSTARIVVQESGERYGHGAGWVVKKEGNTVWIVTNRHVISNKITKILSKKIEVDFFSELPDSERPRYPATIINSTERNDSLDLAVLEVTGIPDDIQSLEMRSGRVQRNANVRIIGHPNTIEDPWSVSLGAVVNYNSNRIKIPISGLSAQGSSGGPVIDSENKVIAMMVEKAGSLDIPPYNLERPNVIKYVNEIHTEDVSLAYRIDTVIEKLQEWGIID